MVKKSLLRLYLHVSICSNDGVSSFVPLAGSGSGLGKGRLVP